ncbi:MAG: Asp-tRNA(Asn)/Glu-tRNA(Gln) amidotransferase subunit GatC [Gammaproteobacteria bacterium]|nr:Asp-tRNA(Asn)/Glu-tRNA(Gln) amidotransferase subunit GatC [Gammaproteobacteria bacterium]
MSIDQSEVARIAHLARLELSADEVPRYAAELSKILEFVGRMSAVDTAGVSPMAHPLDLVQRLREDRVTEADRRDDFQAHAPAVADGLYLVPKVIE